MPGLNRIFCSGMGYLLFTGNAFGLLKRTHTGNAQDA
jgi:hypothetical protein